MSDVASHGKDFGTSSCNGKLLKGSEQKRDVIRLMF